MEKGMFSSDKCKFCGDYYGKVRPYICEDCFKMALEVAREEGWNPPASQPKDAADTQKRCGACGELVDDCQCFLPDEVKESR